MAVYNLGLAYAVPRKTYSPVVARSFVQEPPCIVPIRSRDRDYALRPQRITQSVWSCRARLSWLSLMCCSPLGRGYLAGRIWLVQLVRILVVNIATYAGSFKRIIPFIYDRLSLKAFIYTNGGVQRFAKLFNQLNRGMLVKRIK